jgi:hypothetical protein
MGPSDRPATSGPDLMVLAAELAADLDGVSSQAEAGVVTYRRGQAIFARVSADALEVRLPPDIAEAAALTPDATELPPAQGPGWVRFSPRSQERHDIDRATAWFQAAWRHAEGH